MLTKNLPVRARKTRLTLWLALAFVLLLIGWWELTTHQTQRPLPLPVIAAATEDGHEVAILAGGCFWCVEADFDKLPGVISTTSGYIGGKTANPTYEEVSSHATGHAEAVKIVFDPARLSYRQLVDHFWRTIDPTVRDRQFCDHGTPYRTAIFAINATQMAQALASRTAIEQTKPFKEPILTPVELAGDFYAAEAYHQDYHQKNPVRYSYYRSSCGRDARLLQLWGTAPG
jgi:peptide-methionine (S)-S-oxide reductase